MGKVVSKGLLCVGGWLAAGLMVTGCATTTVSGARMYDMQTGVVIRASLENLADGYGPITARTPDGEALNGEFTVIQLRPEVSHVLSSGTVHGERSAGTDSGESGAVATDSRGPAEMFGFGPGSDANPAGTATSVGDRGTVMQLVLYSLNWLGTTQAGTGIAWDNHGNWYRVHLGPVSEK